MDDNKYLHKSVVLHEENAGRYIDWEGMTAKYVGKTGGRGIVN